MISCNTIGSNGRLGNQMFQAAAVVGISSNLGLKYQFSPGRLNDIFALEEFENSNPQFANFIWREKSFSYDPDVKNLRPNTEIFGYFQTSKYWNHVKNKIIKSFVIKDSLIKDTPPELLHFCNEATSLHLRRTDYLEKPDFHPTFGMSRYVPLLKQNEKIALFTDDVEYGRYFLSSLREFGCSKDSLLISGHGLTDVQEFYLMTLCRRAILANSSFSWWAAYLGPHQKGYEINAPSQWFGKSGPQDTQDIYEDGWIKF